MPKRRTDTRRDGEHRGDAGYHFHIDVAPFRRAMLDRLEYRACHGEHTAVARRHNGHLPPGLCQRQRVPRAADFLAVIRGVAHHSGPWRHAVQIRAVANQVGRIRQGRTGLG